MPIAINSTNLAPTSLMPSFDQPRGTDAAERQRRFASVLSIAERRPGEKPTTEQQARESAEQLVAIGLVQPILAQLRSTDNAAEPFKATQGEKQFRSLWDAQAAQDIVQSSNFPLVDRMVEDMLRSKIQEVPA